MISYITEMLNLLNEVKIVFLFTYMNVSLLRFFNGFRAIKDKMLQKRNISYEKRTYVHSENLMKMRKNEHSLLKQFFAC